MRHPVNVKHQVLIGSLICVAMLGQQEQPRVLSQAEVEALEKTVAKSRDDRAGQKLLGQNYAFFILSITSLDQFGQALRTGGMTPRRYRIRIENEPHTLGEPSPRV